MISCLSIFSNPFLFIDLLTLYLSFGYYEIILTNSYNLFLNNFLKISKQPNNFSLAVFNGLFMHLLLFDKYLIQDHFHKHNVQELPLQNVVYLWNNHAYQDHKQEVLSYELTMDQELVQQTKELLYMDVMDV